MLTENNTTLTESDLIEERLRLIMQPFFKTPMVSCRTLALLATGFFAATAVAYQYLSQDKTPHATLPRVG